MGFPGVTAWLRTVTPQQHRTRAEGGAVAPEGSRNIWGTRTHLSLLQSCLDITLLTLQHFLHLLQLMDGFATQTDLVSQISNFLCQGQKEFGQEGVCGASPVQVMSPSPCPGSADFPQPLGEQPKLCLGTFLQSGREHRRGIKDLGRAVCPTATPPRQCHATAMALSSTIWGQEPFADKIQVALPVLPVSPAWQQDIHWHPSRAAASLQWMG